MNFKATSKFSGLNMPVIESRFAQATQLSVEQSAKIVLEEAEALVPVDTGELRESGHTLIEGTGLKTEGFVIFDADHAAYVEYGTGRRGAASAGRGDVIYDPNWPGMTAQPYLRPALDTARPAMLEVFRDNAAIAARLVGQK